MDITYNFIKMIKTKKRINKSKKKRDRLIDNDIMNYPPYSIVSFNKNIIKACCFLLMIAILYISIICRLNVYEIVSIGIITAIFCFYVTRISYRYLTKLFEEYIIVANDKIIYRRSVIEGRKEETIQTSNLKSILWENESLKSGLGSRHNIYLIDTDSNKHKLVEHKLSGFRTINKSTLYMLSSELKLPINKKKYIRSDLKRR